MDNLYVLNYDGKQVRVVESNGEIWWVLEDVCCVLEISKRMAVKHLDYEEKAWLRFTDNLGRQYFPKFQRIINESGLYSVLLRSDKPQAKPFRKWVTSEAISAICKHGRDASLKNGAKMGAEACENNYSTKNAAVTK